MSATHAAATLRPCGGPWHGKCHVSSCYLQCLPTPRFMPNYDIMNKWEINTTVWLTNAADRLLCKTRACTATMKAWLEHIYPTLPNIGEHEVLFTSFSTPDPSIQEARTSADFTQFLHLMGEWPVPIRTHVCGVMQVAITSTACM